jgi:hypothetical protein
MSGKGNRKGGGFLRVKFKLQRAFMLAMVLAMASAFFVPIYGAEAESMQVHASWLDDEMLRIDVVDAVAGTTSSLAIRLSDFVGDADNANSRHIFIQALDLGGNLSGVIRIDNPFYVPLGSAGAGAGGNQVANPPLMPLTNLPQTPQVPQTGSSTNGSGNNIGNNTGNDIGAGINDNNGDSGAFGNANNVNNTNSADISSNTNSPQTGLTPDGTGTVVDNIVTQNELEFFTVFTEAGNVFYLVIDRQGNTDNVYLLNAVTEADLMALAERDGVHNNHPSGGIGSNGGSVSGIPVPPNQTDPSAGSSAGTGSGEGAVDGVGSNGQLNDDDTQSDPNSDYASSSGGGNNLIFIIIVVLVAGGLAYYFKIVRGKKRSASYNDEDNYADDDDEEDWDYRGEVGYDGHDDFDGGGDFADDEGVMINDEED